MESGFSRQLFARWCSDPRNAVIITSRTAPGTLARTLIDNPSLSTIKLDVSPPPLLLLLFTIVNPVNM